jgi:hypothetical protein
VSVPALNDLRPTAIPFHFTDYRVRVYYIHTTDPSIQKGTSVTSMASDSPKASSQGGSTPPIRPATPSTSKGLRQKLGSLFQRPSSKGKKGGVTEPKPVGAEIVHGPNPEATSTTAPETLLVTTESIDIRPDTIDPARQIVAYKLAIAVIEIFEPVESAESIFSTPVGKALEKLTNVLGVLKVRSLRGDSDSADIMK